MGQQQRLAMNAVSTSTAASREKDAKVGARPEEPCRVDFWAAFVGEGEEHGRELLDDDDRRSCGRLSALAQKQFLTAHILLRLALADAVNGDVLPADWHFAIGQHGKPELAPGLPRLHFSLSHEQRMAVVAVCATNPVGIDVVGLAGCPLEPPIWSASAPSERILLFDQSPNTRAHDFGRRWALKEAYAKMLGVGHALDFATIEVDLERRDLRQTERDCNAVFETHMLWCPDDCYFVALAVGADRAAELDTRGHLLDLTGGSWFEQLETSSQEAVWPKRWKWHWL
jgi:phosphopantetheinyl transferase